MIPDTTEEWRTVIQEELEEIEGLLPALHPGVSTQTLAGVLARLVEAKELLEDGA